MNSQAILTENETTPEHMASIVQNQYGSPEVLKLSQVAVPPILETEVLLKVHASSINAGDWHLMTGKPYLVRFIAGGLLKPGNKIPGQDVSAVVIATGAKVTRFKAGDQVFGALDNGAFSEYAAAPQERLVHKPANLSHIEAGSLPLSAVAALQGLEATDALKPGKKVLINGASGNVGMFAVQLAKEAGAKVMAVCSGQSREFVHSLGADSILDYKRESILPLLSEYDAILDLVGNYPPLKICKAMKQGASYAAFAAGKGNWLGPIINMLKMISISTASKKKMLPMMTEFKRKDLEKIVSSIAHGHLKIPIAKVYALSSISEAMQNQTSAAKTGKIALQV